MKKYIIFLLIFFTAAFLTGYSYSKPQPGGVNTLIVQLQGFRSDKGQAYVGLYNSSNGFPDDPAKAFESRFSLINNGRVTVWFTGIPSGTYAVFAYHDEDSDKTRDANLFPFFSEGWAASNNARPIFGSPSFDDASFSVDMMMTKVQMKIGY